jgi:uncharacterized protein (TIGR02246 family)
MICSMRKIGISALSAMALFLSACSDAPTVDKAAIEKSVKAVEASLNKAAGTKDAAAFSANYTDNAIMMMPGGPPAKGRPAIRAAMSPMFADPAFKLEFSSDRIEISDTGDMAATRGTYTLTVTNPATKELTHDKGSYVTVYRKQTDGAWRAVYDINSSEVAPTPPSASKAAGKKAAAKKSRKKR